MADAARERPCRPRKAPLLSGERAIPRRGRFTMRGRRLQRVAAWLGLVAFAIQAIVPLLVAAEIGLADRAGRHSIFELCAFGHVHVVDPDGSLPGKSGGKGHEDLGAVCPICVALHAAPAFTAPVLVALPLPSPGS